MAEFFQVDSVQPDSSSIAGLNVRWVLSGATVGSTKLTAGKSSAGPGVRGKPHYHNNAEAMMFILKGRVKVIIGPHREEHIVEPGTFCFYRQGEIHGLENVGNDTAEWVFCYAGAANIKEADTVFVE